MLFSTIIPTVNRSTLERAVKSALEQDLPPESHEILVFNNSDGPLPETDWLRSPRVTIIDSHSELIDASNRGARMASGKYINFLHDDDYLLPGALKALVNAAEATGCHWACGAYDLVDDEGNFMADVRPQIKGNIFALLVGGECLPFAASVINRDAFLQAGGFDPQIRIIDIDVESRIALFGNFETIDQLVAGVRVSGGQGTSHNWVSRSKQDYRKLREKVLNAPAALERMQDSVRGDVFRRGRACRAYLISAVLNLRSGHFSMAGRRLVSLLRLVAFYFVLPEFWRGLFFRSHWHSAQKTEQEEYFRIHHPSEQT
jgi:glycosyltransferase involved in cell wall biosynthesis